MMPRCVSTRAPHVSTRFSLAPARKFHNGRRYTHQRIPVKSLEDFKKVIEANKANLNIKNSLGKTSIYSVIDVLPREHVSIEMIDAVFNCMIENGAKLHEEQCLHGSAYTHLMHLKHSNAAFLANLIVNSGLIDIHKNNQKDHSPLFETTQAILKRDYFDHHRCLVNLINKGAQIKLKEYRLSLPYVDFLSWKYQSESSLKSLYLTLFLFTRYEKSTLNCVDEFGRTPLDLASLIDNGSIWKDAIITLLIEKGAQSRKYPRPVFKCYYPTLGDFYNSNGNHSQLSFSRLLR